jgi:hypothetical protein
MRTSFSSSREETKLSKLTLLTRGNKTFKLHVSPNQHPIISPQQRTRPNKKNAWTVCVNLVFHLLFFYCLPIMRKTLYLEGMQLFLWAQLWELSFFQLDSFYGIYCCVYVLDLDHISGFGTPRNMANKS